MTLMWELENVSTFSQVEEAVANTPTSDLSSYGLHTQFDHNNIRNKMAKIHLGTLPYIPIAGLLY